MIAQRWRAFMERPRRAACGSSRAAAWPRARRPHAGEISRARGISPHARRWPDRPAPAWIPCEAHL